MICAFGKSFVIDENEEEEVLVDTFVIAKFTANSQLSSIICEETEARNDLIQSAPSVGQLLVFYYYYYYYYLKLKSIIGDWTGLLIE